MFAASKTDGVSGGPPDAQFNYVTMLLHGDGTNGAQNNTFVDSSSNNFTITRNGNTTQGSFSPYGSSWSNYFGGSSDWLTLPSNAAWTLGSTFTIEAWVNPAVFSANSKRICQADSGIDLSVNSSGYINFNAATTTTALSLNVWSHVAFVCNSGTSTLYINGVASGFTGTNTGVNVSGTSTLTIGTYQTNSGYAWQGYISNFRIVKSSAVYTSNFTPSTTPITAITNTQLLTCQSNRFVDNSSNAFTVTSAGSPSVQRFNPFGTSTAYSTSVIGGSAYFAGSTTNYLNTPTSTSFLFSGNFTVEAWFYKNASGTFGGVFGNYTTNLTSNWTVQLGSSNQLTWYYDSAGVSIASTFVVGQWNHVACVRNGTTLTMYLNGVSVGTATFATPYGSSSKPFLIGTANSDCINGYISDVRVVNGTAVYTSNFTPPTSPLTAITNTALLTNMTNGAIFDNAMMNDLETVGNAQISTSVKKFGTGSMYFDGTGDYLSTPSATANQMGSAPFTIEAWIYPTTISGTHTIVGKYVGGSIANSEYWLFITSTGKLAFVVDGSGAEDYIESSAGAITTNTWIHVAAIKTGSAIGIYINGAIAGSVGSSVTSTSVNTTPLNIGSYNNGSGTYIGYIDDLRITKGVARYSGSSFTVPTAAFPNTGPI